MRRLLLLALLLAPVAAAATPPPASSQWVLAVARVTGLGGEQFVSALRIANPSPVPAMVEITYLAQSPLDEAYQATGDNGSAPRKTVTVAAGETFAADDVLGSLFPGAEAPHGIAAGGLRIQSDVAVTVLSRTYVANATSASGTPGTYGFAIPAVGLDQAIGRGDTALLTLVAASDRADAGFRSNLILLSTAESAFVKTTVSVALVRADGTVAGQRDYTLGRLSAAQQGNVAASFGVTTPDTNLRLAVTVTSGGPVLAGLSLIDNAISSIAYGPPALLPASGRFGWLLVDDEWGLSGGRLDVEAAAPTFLSGLVAVTCTAGTVATPFLAYGPGSVADPAAVNTTFTSNPDGSFSFSGRSDRSGSWSGRLAPWGDGTVRGTLTFTSAATASSCPGVTRTSALQAARVQNLPKTP